MFENHHQMSHLNFRAKITFVLSVRKLSSLRSKCRKNETFKDCEILGKEKEFSFEMLKVFLALKVFVE